MWRKKNHIIDFNPNAETLFKQIKSKYWFQTKSHLIKGSSQHRNEETKLQMDDPTIVFMPVTRLVEPEEKNLVKMVKSSYALSLHSYSTKQGSY